VAATTPSQKIPIVSAARESARPAKPVAKSPPTRVLGKYEILRQLGEGGMGIVYEARHTGTGRLVAVKEIIGETLKKDAQVAERFERETRATATVETQHIALVLDSG